MSTPTAPEDLVVGDRLDVMLDNRTVLATVTHITGPSRSIGGAPVTPFYEVGVESDDPEAPRTLVVTVGFTVDVHTS